MVGAVVLARRSGIGRATDDSAPEDDDRALDAGVDGGGDGTGEAGDALAEVESAPSSGPSTERTGA